jgi:transposase, IS5 family
LDDMYRNSFKGKSQIELDLGAFHTPFTSRLNKENRWVKLAGIIPWKEFEARYSDNFGAVGRQAYPFRMAFGALIIQTKQKLTDRELVEQISENPYFQFFIGLPKYQDTCPFDYSTLAHFRKRITSEMLGQVNETIVSNALTGNPNSSESDKDKSTKKSDDDNDDNSNQGTLILDATCVPEDIRFPTDISLLNDARSATEEMIDIMWNSNPMGDRERKPRTNREKLNKMVYTVLRMKKPRQSSLRRVTKLLIHGLKRNLGHIAVLNKSVSLGVLGEALYRKLLISEQIFKQQKELFRLRRNNASASVPDRIVSLYKPHVRPIVRGKSSAPVEFGMKMSIGVSEGFIHVDHMSFDPYHEGTLLQKHIELFHKRTGHYPKAILADKAYQSRANRELCKSLGIRISGKPLGRPSIFQFIEDAEAEIQRKDNAARNEVESKFGIGKRAKLMGRIMTRLAETSKTVASLIVLVLNLEKVLRVLLLPFLNWLVNWFNEQTRKFEWGIAVPEFTLKTTV